MKSNVIKLLKYISEDINLPLFFSLSISAAIFELISLYFISIVLQRSLNPEHPSATFNLPLLQGRLTESQLLSALVISLLIAGFGRILISWFVHRLGADLTASIKARVFKGIFFQPAYQSSTFIDSGKWVTLLNHDANVAGNSGFVLIYAIGNLLTVIILLAFSIIQAGMLTVLGGVTILSIYYLITRILARATFSRSAISTEQHLLASRLITRATSQRKEIFVYGLGEVLLNQYSGHVKLASRAQNVLVVIATTPRIVVEVAAYIVILAALLGQSDQRLLGDISLLCVIGLRIIPIAQGLYNSVATIRGAESSMEKIVDIIAGSSEGFSSSPTPSASTITSAQEALTNLGRPSDAKYVDSSRFPSGQNTYCISCDRISIGHGDFPILTDFSYHFSNGLYCIIGPSGSGKTSFLEALCGILGPMRGRIIRDSKSRGYLSGSQSLDVAYLPQDFYLYRDTIFNNIEMNRVKSRDIPGFDYHSLCELLCITGSRGFLESDAAMLGDGGEGLSAGQRQRIGLARALYTNPPFVLLDESTANLDAQTESVILRTLKLYSTNAIVIIASHSDIVRDAADSVIDFDFRGRLRGLNE